MPQISRFFGLMKSILVCGMTRFILFFAVIYLFAPVQKAKTQYLWHKVFSERDFPPNTKYYFDKISCFKNNCIVSGFSIRAETHDTLALIWQSIDGGRTWAISDSILKPPTEIWYGPNPINALQQIDSLNAIAIGSFGIIHRTFDGGKTWKHQDLDPFYDLGDVHFSDPNNGIIGSFDGYGNPKITTDGGIHWKNGPLEVRLENCHSYGDGKFRVSSYYDSCKIYTTYDNWKTVDSTQSIQVSLHKFRTQYHICDFYGVDTLIAAGLTNDSVEYQRAVVVRSDDGGKHWVQFTIPIIGQDFSPVTPFPRDTVIAFEPFLDTTHFLSDANKFIISIDHGLTWRLDTMIFDSTFIAPVCLALDVTGDGTPIGIFYSRSGDNGGIVRGEHIKSRVKSSVSSSISIYPNPASSTLKIANADVSHRFHIIEILGREVMHGIMDFQGNSLLDISQLVPGIYSVIVDDHGIIGKIVIDR